MISLPAIESCLMPHFTFETDTAVPLAVVATDHPDKPQIVLYTNKQTDRKEINKKLKDSGLSALHNINKVVMIDAIPQLGTGKTDYKVLNMMAKSGQI